MAPPMAAEEDGAAMKKVEAEQPRRRESKKKKKQERNRYRIFGALPSKEKATADVVENERTNTKGVLTEQEDKERKKKCELKHG